MTTGFSSKRGPRPLPGDNRRVSVLLPAEVLEQIEAKAAAVYMKPTDYLRLQIITSTLGG